MSVDREETDPLSIDQLIHQLTRSRGGTSIDRVVDTQVSSSLCFR